MKKLLYLLLALPFVFAACEPDSSDSHPVKDPKLTLVSNATMEFTSEGGVATVEYTLENAIEGAEFTAECEAEWISNFTFGEVITFDVAENDSDAREAKVIIRYDVTSMEVTVKQAAEVAFTLTSDAVVEFGIEGGSGDIIYTLENTVQGKEVVASCDVDWITYKVFADDSKVSYTVAANEGDARETKIVVAYGTKSFEVTIKQAAKPFDGYELSYINGIYYAPGVDMNDTDNHNYYVQLSSVNDFTTYAPNGVYVELDFWAATVDAENPAIPEGEYIIDIDESHAPGTIGASYTRLLEIDAEWMPIVWILPVEGKVVVSENNIEGYLVDEYGEKVSFRYTGTLVLP